jgi:hypothetical protein
MDDEQMRKYITSWTTVGTLEEMDKLLEDYIRDSDDKGEGIALGTPVGKPGFSVAGDSICSVAMTVHYFMLYQKENPDKRLKDGIIEFVEKYGRRNQGLLGGLLFLHGDITECEMNEVIDYMKEKGIIFDQGKGDQNE